MSGTDARRTGQRRDPGERNPRSRRYQLDVRPARSGRGKISRCGQSSPVLPLMPIGQTPIVSSLLGTTVQHSVTQRPALFTLPIGNIASIIHRCNCLSTRRTPDDSLLSIGSRSWTGSDKPRSDDDCVRSRSTAIRAIVLHSEAACMRCDWRGGPDYAFTSRISMEPSCYCLVAPERGIRSGPSSVPEKD